MRQRIKPDRTVAPGVLFLGLLCFLGIGLFQCGSPDAAERERKSDQRPNTAVAVELVRASLEEEPAGEKAPSGRAFYVLDTVWENIHPKQKVDKKKLEGKVDRTMGVGGLRGGGTTQETEYVDMDVAYVVKAIYDHAYVLADGFAYPLHPATEKISGGTPLFQPLNFPKLGDRRGLNLVYSVPEESRNLAFKFFDYQYGHIVLPIKGDIDKARGDGKPSGRIIGEARSNLFELAVHDLDFRTLYQDKPAPPGWQYAVATASGVSVSGGKVMNIVQLKPNEYTWVVTDGGYLHYGLPAPEAVKGFVRFTPEIPMIQEMAFLVPESAAAMRLGIRVNNEVFHIDLKGKPKGFPRAAQTHTDGDIMEFLVFGVRGENGMWILDLGIRSFEDRRGLTIQPHQQFVLASGDKKISFDPKSTDGLAHKPPKTFIVPPGESLRFELAYKTAERPDRLFFRGFKSQAELDLPVRK